MVSRRSTLVVLLTTSLVGAVASCASDDDVADRDGHDDRAAHEPTGRRRRAPGHDDDPGADGDTTDAPGITIPGDRRRELEEAGLGWMLEVEYPAQPAGVPWPTAAWPTGPLPIGVDPRPSRRSSTRRSGPVAPTPGRSTRCSPSAAVSSCSRRTTAGTRRRPHVVVDGQVRHPRPDRPPGGREPDRPVRGRRRCPSGPTRPTPATPSPSTSSCACAADWPGRRSTPERATSPRCSTATGGQTAVTTRRPSRCSSSPTRHSHTPRHVDDPGPDHRRPGGLRRGRYGVGPRRHCSTRSASPPSPTT